MPCNLSLAEYELISMLSEAPGGQLRMSALAELIVQSRSRVTHTVSRLEARDLVSRCKSATDRRGVLLTLTPAGRAVLDEAAKVHVASVQRHFVTVLTAAQLRALGTAMSALREHHAGEPRGPQGAAT